MNKNKTQNEQDFLQSLFAQARDSEPLFAGESFNATVMASLPVRARQQYLADTEIPRRFGLVDVAGLGLGLVACFSLVDPTQLFSLVFSAMPDKLVLTPMTILTTSLAMTALAASAWYTLEGEALQ